MTKITIIGAGSIVFTKNLIGDILSILELADSTISLMDIDGGRLDIITKLAKRMVQQTNKKAVIESSTDRKKAIKNSNYVITTFQIGGLEYYAYDLEIPAKYGLNQGVGDTLGPGAVFRAMRTIPVILDLCRDMEEVCPDALLMNYVNPMAMITWAVNTASNIKCVGLCHSVQETAKNIASYIDVPFAELTYNAAGINHMAWYLELKWKGKNVYPMLFEAMKNPDIYNKDITKFVIMKMFGYFITESSYHVSEYMPYFRQSQDMIDKINRMDSWLKQWNGDCFAYVNERQSDFYEKVDRQIAGLEPVDITRSYEYGPGIIHAIETGVPYKIYGNVMNKGLIANLLNDCCVEVPCLVDKCGITPCYVGKIPPQLAGLNSTNINVQELAVHAAINGDQDAAIQAVLLDPLTASVVPYQRIKDMVMEMFEVEKNLLPQFK